MDVDKILAITILMISMTSLYSFISRVFPACSRSFTASIRFLTLAVAPAFPLELTLIIFPLSSINKLSNRPVFLPLSKVILAFLNPPLPKNTFSTSAASPVAMPLIMATGCKISQK